MRKIISVFAVLFIGLSLLFALPASAAALTNVTDTLTSSVVSATTTHTVAFTTVGALAVAAPADQIIITFPVGFDASGATLNATTITPSTTDPTITNKTITVVTLDVSADEAAGAFSIVLDNVVNSPTANDNYVVSVETQDGASVNIDGPTNSDAFSIVPTAIGDLACVATGQAGTVMLSWTVPVGTTGGYEVVHQTTVINDDGTYNTAIGSYVAGATWANGTVGVASWNLVQGLTPNQTYWFGMKAKGANTTISAIPTNIAGAGIFCMAPTASSSTYTDNIAPTSTITDPTYGSTILVNQPYTVKGTAMDTGGSSVQKLEISLDDGVTWNTAVITDVSGDNSLWQYVWSNLAVGEYILKTKATDWCNNVETPGTGITVTVATELPTTTTPPTTTPPTVTPPTDKPITEMTVPELRTKIAEIQQQIIDLLTQLIQILQNQLAQL